MLFERILPAFLLSLLFPGCAAPPAEDADRAEQIEARYQESRQRFAAVNEVTPQGVLDMQEAGDAVLVDVRTPAEQAVSMLPGAITRETFEADRERYRDQTVITYCTIGGRSGAYAATLKEAGFSVFNLKGSILAWTHAGLPLVDATGADTKRVHTNGPKWDLVARGYEAVWE